MNSSRLPGKSLTKIDGKPLIEWVINRCYSARKIDGVYLATTKSNTDDTLVDFASVLVDQVFRGSEENVLSRLATATSQLSVDTVVRITGDNPLVGPDVIDWALDKHTTSNSFVTSLYHTKTFPNGTVVSVFESDALLEMEEKISDEVSKEHIVTGLSILDNNGYEINTLSAPQEWNSPYTRYCVDYKEDLKVVKSIVNNLKCEGRRPSTKKIIEYLEDNPNIAKINYKYAKNLY